MEEERCKRKVDDDKYPAELLVESWQTEVGKADRLARATQWPDNRKRRDKVVEALANDWRETSAEGDRLITAIAEHWRREVVSEGDRLMSVLANSRIGDSFERAEKAAAAHLMATDNFIRVICGGR